MDTNLIPKNGDTVSSSTPDAQGNNTNFEKLSIPTIAVPTGGAALRSIDDKFKVNAANGTGSFSVPLPFSKPRNSFTPALSLNYNSGSGNSAFGLGWSCTPASIRRKTDKRLPAYSNEDTFLLSEMEDLVPSLNKDGLGNWIEDTFVTVEGTQVTRFRPSACLRGISVQKTRFRPQRRIRAPRTTFVRARDGRAAAPAARRLRHPRKQIERESQALSRQRA